MIRINKRGTDLWVMIFELASITDEKLRFLLTAVTI